ncbi:anhydro-N-acetylmuramic acid kinase [Isoptericola sp. S6320L]|uniref:anhydro-N-acetylmuramic acid kinase n=1 Tax=Isoptericola sp. S6320L TaxID=2926411 RepID=UPI001FF2A48E|nr:anhydro-N-acetylmuramic acid kinase [Isoptericola sp. S6320L]MCK0117424.1 anhydro-N-acetylmuramic acid kinase [Isoptericola sp. S6320L]
MIVAGLMAGTSADALDVALVELTLDESDGTAPGGELAMDVLDFREVEFDEDLGLDILRLLEPRDVPLALVSSVDTRFGQACADAVADACARAGVTADLVVMHGQTVRHDVHDGAVTGTWQIGQPAWVAERTGSPVLSDVRSRDVAAGGQGAPLAGMLDHLLLAGADVPTAALNLGGIANVTVVAPSRDTVAFDTGPANALIDVMARRMSGDPRGVDTGGALAARGVVVPALLDDLLAEPYYALPAPKSTGKELFHAAYLDRFLAAHGGLDDHDVIATLTTLTARTVADACHRYGVRSVVASGGGTRNPTLMAALRRELGSGVAVGTTHDALGLPEAAKEACLMALVGWLSWHGLPATLPSVTGASHGTVAGRFTPGSAPLQLPEPRDDGPRRLRLAR